MHEGPEWGLGLLLSAWWVARTKVKNSEWPLIWAGMWVWGKAGADEGPPGWLPVARTAQHGVPHPPADPAQGNNAPLLSLQTPSVA